MLNSSAKPEARAMLRLDPRCRQRGPHGEITKKSDIQAGNSQPDAALKALSGRALRAASTP
jgi:hypothetical protein